jgi:hypothetical protein
LPHDIILLLIFVIMINTRVLTDSFVYRCRSHHHNNGCCPGCATAGCSCKKAGLLWSEVCKHCVCTAYENLSQPHTNEADIDDEDRSDLPLISAPKVHEKVVSTTTLTTTTKTKVRQLPSDSRLYWPDAQYV